MSCAVDFSKLVDEVHACRICPRMKSSTRVLSFASGRLDAPLMFIGEAPGRLGADKSQIPFHGDTAGNNFEALLEFAGISREDVYITNAVLCNPRDSKGNNATPNIKEVTNCSAFLRRQIDLVDPKVVVTLGGTALNALRAVEQHEFTLAGSVRSAQSWYGRLLVPLYHPGQRAMIHRSHANQRSDYQFVADTLRTLGKARRRTQSATGADVLEACRYMLRQKGELSYFELHKLAYLAEYLHVKATGSRMTRAYFIRQKDGPYCVDLSIQRLKNADPLLLTRKRKGKLFLSLGGKSGELFDKQTVVEPSADIKETLDRVLARYSYPSDADLKRAVYLTGPMRMMLRREKFDGVNLYNAPIDFLSS